jgi:hypothetical protein
MKKKLKRSMVCFIIKGKKINNVLAYFSNITLPHISNNHGTYTIPQILVSFSSLGIPTIPTVLTYNAKSKYLKQDLPCKPGESDVLELRLLSGDLDNHSEMSTTANTVLREFETSDKFSFANPIFLLAGHGFGKTKTIFDVAGERFTILIDASEKKLVADVREMINRVNDNVYGFYLVNYFRISFLTFSKGI